jgi:hypothetical protein
MKYYSTLVSLINTGLSFLIIITLGKNSGHNSQIENIEGLLIIQFGGGLIATFLSFIGLSKDFLNLFNSKFNHVIVFIIIIITYLYNLNSIYFFTIGSLLTIQHTRLIFQNKGFLVLIFNLIQSILIILLIEISNNFLNLNNKLIFGLPIILMVLICNLFIDSSNNFFTSYLRVKFSITNILKIGLISLFFGLTNILPLIFYRENLYSMLIIDKIACALIMSINNYYMTINFLKNKKIISFKEAIVTISICFFILLLIIHSKLFEQISGIILDYKNSDLTIIIFLISLYWVLNLYASRLLRKVQIKISSFNNFNLGDLFILAFFPLILYFNFFPPFNIILYWILVSLFLLKILNDKKNTFIN